MWRLVVASQNQGKIKEMQEFFSDLDVELIPQNVLGIDDAVEDAVSFVENALIKARHVHKITGFPTIADDTGLEVDALDGKPGVYTARFAGENCSYDDNVNKMLKLLENVEDVNRGAIFKTVMAFVDKKSELLSEGTVKGIIAKNKKGLAGFGYDTIFYALDEGKTFAEMTIEKKNIISHRGKAIKNLLPKLLSYFKNHNTTKESA